jgi:predicted RNA-binding protein
MCEAKVYVTEDGEDRRVMEDVVLIRPEGDGYLLVNILGQEKRVRGRLKQIDLLRHTVHLSGGE